MSSISFTKIDVSADGWLRCDVTRETTEELHIQLPYSFTPEPDLIARAFTTLCGTKFEKVHFDLPLGPDTSRQLGKILQADLSHAHGQDRRRRPGTDTALNFSGGFDSLAARSFLPKAHLVSLDFGGRFEREERFFRTFNPLAIKTNLTDLGLNRNSWQFMGIGSILLRDELNLANYSFGSIMAGSLPLLTNQPLDQSTGGMLVANELQMQVRNPVAGLSEISSLMMAVNTFPALLPRSLASVALPQEDKYRRKHLMLEAVGRRQGFAYQIDQEPLGAPRMKWGQSFATDLASLYVMKILGAEKVVSSYAGETPDSVIDFVEKSSFNFMERVNPHAYKGVDRATSGRWYQVMLENGIEPYYREDWIDAAAASDLLQNL